MRCGAAAVALSITMTMSGCGGPSEDQLAAARRDGAAEASKAADAERTKAEQKKLAAEVAAAAKAAADAAAAAKAAAAARNSVTSGGTSTGASRGVGGTKHCGGNISVNSATSCPFAVNVAADWRSNGGGSTSFWTYSPVTGTSYWMRCSAGIPTVCRGGNNAVVYIR